MSPRQIPLVNEDCLQDLRTTKKKEKKARAVNTHTHRDKRALSQPAKRDFTCELSCLSYLVHESKKGGWTSTWMWKSGWRRRRRDSERALAHARMNGRAHNMGESSARVACSPWESLRVVQGAVSPAPRCLFCSVRWRRLLQRFWGGMDIRATVSRRFNSTSLASPRTSLLFTLV